MPAKALQTQMVGYVPFAVTDEESVCEWLLSQSASRLRGANIRLLNAYNIALAEKDPAYRAAVTNDGLNLPDGLPVVWFMRALGLHNRARRVRGPSLFRTVLEKSAIRGTKHFFLGSTQETLDAMVGNAERYFPGIRIAGSYSPPFSELDDEYVQLCLSRVLKTKPDIVWVGLGTPKQDYLSARLVEETSLLYVNVGAAFDYLAGTVREAPHWLQNSGFEWFFRLIVEPRRLWRRYFVGNMQFLISAIGHFPKNRSFSNREHA